MTIMVLLLLSGYLLVLAWSRGVLDGWIAAAGILAVTFGGLYWLVGYADRLIAVFGHTP